MATYYIDETTPAQDSRQQANINAGMDSMLQSLDRMEASRQRGKYYDYLNEIQKQKLGAAKAKDREDAHIQKSANKQNEILFNNARESLIDSREVLAKNIAYLDKEIGFARFPGLTQEEREARIELEQEKMADGTGFYTPAALTYPDQKPADRLEDYRKLLNDDKATGGLVSGTGGAMLFNRLREALSQADDAVAADTKLSKYLQTGIPGSRPTVGEGGVADFEFIPRRDQIKFFKNQYDEHPFKGTRIEPGSADAADAATYGQDRAESPSSLPGGPLVGQEGYMTDVGPGGEGDRFLAYRDPDSLPEEAKRGITREHVTPLESYPVPTGEVRPSGGLLEMTQPKGFSPAALADAIDAVMAREERQPASLEAAIRRPEQVAPQENPYLEIVDRNAFDLVDEPRPAVEGNRPIRLDQLEGPVSGDATVTEEQARTPEYLQEGFRIPGNRGIANPYESVYQPWYDQKSAFEKAMHMDEQSRVPQGASPLMERIPPQDRDSQPGAFVPYKDPRFEAGMGFADTGTGQYVQPFDRGPLIDRSYPEMGRVNDADYPTSLQGDIVELNTMDGPVLMRRLNSPLMNKHGYFPSMKEVLPELRSPEDYEPYPGNPLYLPGGPLYEEEE